MGEYVAIGDINSHMPRKTKLVPITAKCPEDKSRDIGKHFLITEMPAAQAEKWAMRAYLAMSHARIEVPQEIVALGIIGVAMIGMRAFSESKWIDLEPLADEMMGCVQICPDPNNLAVVRGLIADDIEEVPTRMFLRKEVLELHAGFTHADAIWMLGLRVSAKTQEGSQTTSTSPG